MRLRKAHTGIHPAPQRKAQSRTQRSVPAGAGPLQQAGDAAPRTCTRRKGRDHTQLATSDRHNGSTTECSAETSGLTAASDRSAQTGHRVAPVTDLALARHRRQDQDAHRARRDADSFDGVPRLDRTSLVAPSPHGTTTSSTAPGYRAPLTLALHPSGRRRVERRGRTLLRRAPDVLRLGRAHRRRLVALPVRADAGSRDRLRAVRLLTRVARRAVAQYVTTVSRSGLGGSLRTW